MNADNDIIAALGREAREASGILAQAGTEHIHKALLHISGSLRQHETDILNANAQDVGAAEDKGQSSALIDRLTLNPGRIEAMAAGVEAIAALEDPVGVVLEEWARPNGLRIRKMAVPIGVLGMIYESRPNVTIDAAALCLKSHNAVILRGGSESLRSSQALHGIIQTALRETDLPAACVSMVPSADRELVGDMLRADRFIDVMIPRGGRGLTERVMNEARMPVFAHLDGNCHIYVHESADPALAKKVVLNAKMRRTGICGAAESLLLDRTLPPGTAQNVLGALLDAGCFVVGDAESRTLDERIGKASEEDWSTEYLEAKISCKTVNGVKEAVDHINRYGSHHTDGILAEDGKAAGYFLKNVDSAIVMHNTSTQFADGGEFGMGAEIGIGTGKLHARGPVGVRQLTTFKYIVLGNGQTRS